ncbi:MAG: hypothetical protein LBD53_04645, partial [Tannerella sp.]|nr:hypothetical protein [Tannerella sp.]
MSVKYRLIIFLCAALFLSCAAKETADIVPIALTCEYLTEPLSIDAVQPRLAWKIKQTDNARKGQLQTAYQIIVASSAENLDADKGDLWNSGKVK